MNKQAVSSGPRACTLRLTASPCTWPWRCAFTWVESCSLWPPWASFRTPNWPIPPPPSCSQPPALLPQGSSGSYAPSANEQFFVGAQTVVSFLQTTQITSDVCLITDHVAYASTDKTWIVWIETKLFFFFFFFFFNPGWMRLLFTCVLGR